MKRFLYSIAVWHCFFCQILLAQGTTSEALSYGCALPQQNCTENIVALPYYLTSNVTYDPLLYVGADTESGADTSEIAITAGHLNPNIANGAYLWAYGNEHSQHPGNWYLRSGEVSTGDGGYGHLSGRQGLRFQRSSASGPYPTIWTLDTVNGHFSSDSSNGGDIRFSKAATTIAIQEATAGEACMGTVTATGTTAVTVATTCATTGARVLLTRSSAPSGTAQCWYDTIVNATSFNLDCDGAETGTFSWFILKEAP